MNSELVENCCYNPHVIHEITNTLHAQCCLIRSRKSPVLTWFKSLLPIVVALNKVILLCLTLPGTIFALMIPTLVTWKPPWWTVPSNAKPTKETMGLGHGAISNAIGFTCRISPFIFCADRFPTLAPSPPCWNEFYPFRYSVKTFLCLICRYLI